jgi:PAS domain S-box-containing protein
MPSPELTARQLNVLLVEDNPDDAFLLERHLKRNGFDVAITRVETAEEMLVALDQKEAPEVVLADYNLPNFSGPAALLLLKNAGIDIPFIMMSGAVSEETAVESMRAGAQDYVSKQNLTRLTPALERELREAAARRRRRAAEHALRASEMRFHRLVEAMPLSLIISTASGRILYANSAAERLLGYVANDASSEWVTLDLICPPLRKTYSTLTEQTAAIEPFEAVCTKRNGHTVEVLIGVALLNPEAEAGEQQFAAFIADLTLQKKGEEVLRQTEKLAVAGRLAASIAHEINNPLEAITNCLYLLSTTALEAESRAYLDLAQKELQRVTQITVQTLRFYRRSTKPTQTDVHELIETVLVLFESRLLTSRIEVVRQFKAKLAIMAHDGEIRQVIVNLVGNAIDALAAGGRLLIRTTESHERQSGRKGLRITVADGGIGMSGQTLARIFEPFYSTKGITGAGLGLWVSREIVDRHQGLMRARSRESVPGRAGGTVFTLFIPAELDPLWQTRREGE